MDNITSWITVVVSILAGFCGLAVYLGKTKEDTKVLSTEIRQLQDTVIELKEDIKDLQQDNKEIEKEINGTQIDLAGIKAGVDSLNRDITFILNHVQNNK